MQHGRVYHAVSVVRVKDFCPDANLVICKFHHNANLVICKFCQKANLVICNFYMPARKRADVALALGLGKPRLQVRELRLQSLGLDRRRLGEPCEQEGDRA